jgi:predicted ArsR family transcriptional regulator
VTGPRDIIDALGRGGSAAAIVRHLIQHGPSSAGEISSVFAITRAGARAQLVALRAGGVVTREDPAFRLLVGGQTHRYYVDPDALRYAARWLEVLAERAERANRVAGVAPLAGGRTR